TNASSVNVAGLPTGVTASYDGSTGVLTISGAPTAVGTFSYTAEPVGCGTAVASGTITVLPNRAITLTSGAGTNNQEVCVGAAITPITYSVIGATSVNVSGLPAGVTASYNSSTGVLTISGAPTVVGSFSYTVSPTGCGPNVTASGTITVRPARTTTRTSAAGTDNQEVCVGAAITPITYSVTNATSVNVTGLPAGVMANYDAGTGVLTISGTPTVAGTFSYTAEPVGCGTAVASGTITVKP
ncbi:MAG: hypothetical protein NZ821_09950, partial [Gloeomargarita sp. SKYB31]|nr:hypothetical protein [Gloeomargarita sp. SKYB31]